MISAASKPHKAADHRLQHVTEVTPDQMLMFAV